MSAVLSSVAGPRTQVESSRAARFFNPMRLASYLLGLYALGHTSGAVLRTPRFGAQSDAVVAAMKAVHVSAHGADCTWYGFYRGFGLLVTVFFVFSAIYAWQLGGADARTRRTLAPVTSALFLGYAASMALTWVYFFPVPSVFSTAITGLLGFACIQDWRSGKSTAAPVAA